LASKHDVEPFQRHGEQVDDEVFVADEDVDAVAHAAAGHALAVGHPDAEAWVRGQLELEGARY